ncbi:MAG: elongation factor Ts, partial [Lysobacterales bacterium]
RGLELAAKKGGRAATEGRVEAYIHGGAKIGVIVEVSCETDFVSSSEDFIQFSKDVAMQIAAANPIYIKREDIPEAEFAEQANADVYAKEVCLLEQPFVKDSSQTLQDSLNELIAKIGENIFVGRFTRYKVGAVE